jgi:hypothetical protein
LCTGSGPATFETFTILKVGDPGGGDVVNVNRTGIGAWEIFRLSFE